MPALRRREARARAVALEASSRARLPGGEVLRRQLLAADQVVAEPHPPTQPWDRRGYEASESRPAAARGRCSAGSTEPLVEIGGFAGIERGEAALGRRDSRQVATPGVERL